MSDFIKYFTPAAIMGAYYDKINNRNKKRVDIFRRDNGEFLKRYFHHGGGHYVYAFFAESFTPDKYIIKVYEIGDKSPLIAE